MMYGLSDLEIIQRVILSFVLGGIIGCERMYTNRPAGLRTHMLVCISGSLAMMINFKVFEILGNHTNMDPGRMGSYFISGMGFLGAGTIIKEGVNVKGLTTAASLWACGIIGLACGTGLYFISIVSTICITFTLFVMNKLEHRITNTRNNRESKLDM